LVDTDNDSDYQVSNNNGVFTIKDTTNNVDRITILPNGGISFNAGTDTSGISISNTGSPSLGHLFIYGDNGLIRFRNNSNTYTAKIGYNEGGNTLFFNNEEAGTELSVIADGAKLIDNKKFICGYDNDLQIYHDGSNSYLQDSGTGHLIITSSHLQVKNSGNSELIAKFIEDGAVELYYDHQKKFETTSAGATVTGHLSISGHLYPTTDDASDLGSSALRFRNQYISANGSIDFLDNGKIKMGNSDDLEIYHNGSHSFFDRKAGGTGDIYVRLGTDNAIIAKTDGAVELYHDNSKKFETNSVGTLTTGTSKVAAHAALNGNTDYNGQNFSFLVSYVGGNDTNDEGNGICFAQQYASSDASSTVRTGAIIGYKSVANGSFGGGLQFKVQQAGATPLLAALKMDHQGTLYMPHDNQPLKIGASQDLQIYHDGSSYITNSTGYLFIHGNDIALRSVAQENYIVCDANAEVELYYDGSKKLETTSGGVGISGFLDIPSDSNRLRLGASNDLQIYHNGTINYIEAVSGDLQLIGNSSEKFAVFAQNGAAELYFDNSKKLETTSNGITVTGSVTTQDMNMSNLNGSANEVDNTKGSWSIQEGSDDLFIINRVTGKKYKFNLTEIS